MKNLLINCDKVTEYISEEGVGFIKFNNLKKYEGIITHCFTTRLGGVSCDECSSLNLGFNRNDKRENVFENFLRVSKALNINHQNMVLSNQVHDIKIRVVDENDRGKGLIKESDIIGFDGLITNKKDIALVTFYADCVPVFFFEPHKKVIGVSHSGWRGTVKEIAKETVMKMQEEYDIDISKVEVAIGPSIGSCCFEVGDEVYDEFVSILRWSEKFCFKSDKGKWHINLQKIIEQSLINYGLDKNKISVPDICTKCNNDVFFSFRGDNGKTGNLAGIIQIL